MTLTFISMISLTSIVTQIFILIMYSLGVLFYNFNKSVSASSTGEEEQLRTEESVEYFSQALEIQGDLKDGTFTNFDDYSAFSKESTIELKPSETKEQTINESTVEDIDETKTDTFKTLEDVGQSDENEDYVVQNSILTATVEEEDFEQITFNLQSEQENSITMATDEDIIKVFQKQEPNDWAVRISKAHN